MDKSHLPRREFLRRTATATTALAGAAGLGAGLSSCDSVVGILKELAVRANPSRFKAHGIPTRMLGKTGDRVPLIAVGTGSRFMAMADEDAVDEILNRALDNGLYYFDTAGDYANPRISAEERIGRTARHRRDEIFLSTKVLERNPDAARRSIDRSLQRLQTDFLDVCHVHSVESVHDVEAFIADNGILPVLQSLKEEGVIRHLGFSGHTSAAGMKRAAETGAFDLMLVSLDQYQSGRQPFERDAVTAATARGMGVLVMKVIRPAETNPSFDPAALLRYALSLKHVTAAVVGIDSLDVLEANASFARDYVAMTGPELSSMDEFLQPFFGSPELPWRKPGYRDGFIPA